MLKNEKVPNWCRKNFKEYISMANVRSFTIYFIFYFTDNLQGAMVSLFSQIGYGIC